MYDTSWSSWLKTYIYPDTFIAAIAVASIFCLFLALAGFTSAAMVLGLVTISIMPIVYVLSWTYYQIRKRMEGL